jgi:peptidylprolyl isomerase
MKKWLLSLITGLFITSSVGAQTMDKENTLYLDTENGRVTIELYPDVAPNHVARIKELTREGFYNGVKFHRVIPGFMAQTGDPTGTGMGGSGKKLKAEFNKKHHGRGTVSMARAMDPNSAGSQFFVMVENSPHLDGQYAAFGKVTEGIEVADAIVSVKTDWSDKPLEDQVIETIVITEE